MSESVAEWGGDLPRMQGYTAVHARTTNQPPPQHNHHQTGGIGDSPQEHVFGDVCALVGMQQRPLEYGLEGTVDLNGLVCLVTGHSSHGVHVMLIDQHRVAGVSWDLVVGPSNLIKVDLQVQLVQLQPDPPPAGALRCLPPATELLLGRTHQLRCHHHPHRQHNGHQQHDSTPPGCTTDARRTIYRS